MLCRDDWWLLVSFRQPPIIGDKCKTRTGFGEACIWGLRPPFGSDRPHSRSLVAYRNHKFKQITVLHKLNRRMLTLDTNDSKKPWRDLLQGFRSWVAVNNLFFKMWFNFSPVRRYKQGFLTFINYVTRFSTVGFLDALDLNIVNWNRARLTGFRVVGRNVGRL